jgi:hypothetical protein
MDIIFNKPIVMATTADVDAVGLHVSADVAVHTLRRSLTSPPNLTSSTNKKVTILGNSQPAKNRNLIRLIWNLNRLHWSSDLNSVYCFSLFVVVSIARSTSGKVRWSKMGLYRDMIQNVFLNRLYSIDCIVNRLYCQIKHSRLRKTFCIMSLYSPILLHLTLPEVQSPRRSWPKISVKRAKTEHFWIRIIFLAVCAVR